MRNSGKGQEAGDYPMTSRLTFFFRIIGWWGRHFNELYDWTDVQLLGVAEEIGYIFPWITEVERGRAVAVLAGEEGSGTSSYFPEVLIADGTKTTVWTDCWIPVFSRPGSKSTGRILRWSASNYCSLTAISFFFRTSELSFFANTEKKIPLWTPTGLPGAE